MRTIKFRGRSKGEWHYGDLSIHHDGMPVIFRNVLRAGKWIGEGFNCEPTTIGQFTSLFDRNGREIYEGDLLKFHKDRTGVIEVRFVRGVFAFLWNGNLDDEMPINSPTHEWAEVIGNIHDNPELLKGGVR